LKIRLQLGTIDFADMLYYRSEYAAEERRRANRDPGFQPEYAVLFGSKEGRIAKANRGKDPLFMFAALQRQLGYPAIPRAKPRSEGSEIHPALQLRLQRMEKQIQLLEMELKGGIDLKKFYAKPPDVSDQDEMSPRQSP
jgi:hypothetical protein